MKDNKWSQKLEERIAFGDRRETEEKSVKSSTGGCHVCGIFKNIFTPYLIRILPDSSESLSGDSEGDVVEWVTLRGMGQAIFTPHPTRFRNFNKCIFWQSFLPTPDFHRLAEGDAVFRLLKQRFPLK